MATLTEPHFATITTDRERDDAEAYLLQLNQAPDVADHLDEIKRIGELVVTYEREHGHTLDTPFTLREILEAEMYKRRIKQRGLAELLGVHETRLSELMKNKRPISFEFAQKLWHVLGVPAERVLALPLLAPAA
jgi:HTH-type transcriptional regulator/antitoxin HigA